MQKTIELQKQQVNYMLKVSKRAKRMRLAVYCDGSCVVTTPRAVHESIIERFLISKAKWVLDKIDYFSKFKPETWSRGTHGDYIKYKGQALEIVQNRIQYFNQFYGYTWNRVAIKNQKTRWGSCSKRGNLNFNYKIALLPPEMSDYIIVHELCHLGEFNHSHRFWNLVAKTTPNYLEIRNNLKKNNLKL